ncbi:hypothetical protein CYMTET_36742 [Cymbomonas tetramitiformis]|uniref:Uncharacterized protein n=1 Tax=Cymbomonas tetramitiformis TaxID=36881 RepID=A0AAE0CH36_9CHLO|nr:hypothetical protein CYMTET_36742 [Cymbomonas tetramitiformis]
MLAPQTTRITRSRASMREVSSRARDLVFSERSRLQVSSNVATRRRSLPLCYTTGLIVWTVLSICVFRALCEQIVGRSLPPVWALPPLVVHSGSESVGIASRLGRSPSVISTRLQPLSGLKAPAVSTRWLPVLLEPSSQACPGENI